MPAAVAMGFIVVWGLAVVTSGALTVRAALATRGRDDSGLVTSVWVSAGATLPGTAAFVEFLIHLMWRPRSDTPNSETLPLAMIPLCLWWLAGPALLASSRDLPFKATHPPALDHARRANTVAWAISSLWVLVALTAV
jgi:hypothetical protein